MVRARARLCPPYGRGGDCASPCYHDSSANAQRRTVMKLVQLEDVPLVRGLEHRGGTFHSQTTAEGQPGTPGNFKFSLSRLGTDYSGPRHRHNFDQYRYMIEGHSEYGKDGELKAGMLGYY